MRAVPSVGTEGSRSNISFIISEKWDGRERRKVSNSLGIDAAGLADEKGSAAASAEAVGMRKGCGNLGGQSRAAVDGLDYIAVLLARCSGRPRTQAEAAEYRYFH